MFLLLLKRIIPPPSPAICVEGKDKSERRINGELWLTFCICTRQKTRTHAQTQETMFVSARMRPQLLSAQRLSKDGHTR